MKVNIVCEDSGWILGRCGKELWNNIPDASKNSNGGDINYFINYARYKKLPGINVAHFTHLEEKPPFRDVFLNVMKIVKYATCTCDITYEILSKAGIDHIWKIPYGSDERVAKPGIKFGVVGSVKPSGRKGEHLVRMMLDAGFDVYAWGSGWPCKTAFNTWIELPQFYKLIDYLVVTSTIEGGPVPVIDAIRAGIPVIAPNVGWCWEYPVIRYEKGIWKSLHDVLLKLTTYPTWANWAKEHQKMFEEVYKSGAKS